MLSWANRRMPSSPLSSSAVLSLFMRSAYSPLSKCSAIASCLFQEGCWSECDGRNLPAVVRLATVGGATVAEETLLVRVGTGVDPLDGAQPGPFQPGLHVAGKIEQPVSLARRRAEEPCVLRVRIEKPFAKLRSHLVGLRRDAWSDGGHDVGAIGAEPLHGGDHRIGDAGERTTPAGMRGPDHAGAGVGEQNWRAVGGCDAERKAWPGRHQAVGLRGIVPGPRRLDLDDVGTVMLVRRDQFAGSQPERGGDVIAIAAHRLAVVTGTVADVERGV